MTAHRWKLYPPSATCPFAIWHCPGCSETSREEQPPLGECLGKQPRTAQGAAITIQMFERLGWPLPADFWESRGAMELRKMFDAGVEAE